VAISRLATERKARHAPGLSLAGLSATGANDQVVRPGNRLSDGRKDVEPFGGFCVDRVPIVVLDDGGRPFVCASGGEEAGADLAELCVVDRLFLSEDLQVDEVVRSLIAVVFGFT
jgi:hypothetical protein